MEELKQMILKNHEAASAWVERTKAVEQQMKALQGELDNLQKRAGRPGAAGDNGAANEQRKAIDAFLRGKVDRINDAKALQFGLQTKGLSVGVDADGGYAVPEDLNRTLLEREAAAVPMRQIATVEPAQNESKEQIFSLGGAGGGRVGETDARPDTTTPQLASVQPKFTEYYAQPKATQKMLDDAFFDAGGWLVREVVKTFATFENDDFINGDGGAGGTPKPKGLLSYTLSTNPTFGQIKKITTGVSGGIDADKLIEVANEGLPVDYLPNARWMMARSMLRVIRQLKDSNGRYLFDSESKELLGFPITLNDSMPAPGAASKSIAFGDFKQGYWITDVRGVRVLVDPYTDKPNIRYYCTKRTGGGVLDSQALCIVTLEV